MKRSRLLTLAKFLEKIPPKKFDMGIWMKSSKADVPLEKVIRQVKGEDYTCIEPLHCKTSGCALGWGATIPEFRKAGLKLHYDPSGESIDVVFKGYLNFHAAEEFFDISWDAAEYLFNPSSVDENTPKAVAERIRAYATTKKIPHEYHG